MNFEFEAQLLDKLGVLEQVLGEVSEYFRRVAKFPKGYMKVNEVCEYCGFSRSHWYRMQSAQQAPEPIRVRGRTLWSVEEVDAWMKAGSPSLRKWNQIKAMKEDA